MEIKHHKSILIASPFLGFFTMGSVSMGPSLRSAILLRTDLTKGQFVHLPVMHSYNALYLLWDLKTYW